MKTSLTTFEARCRAALLDVLHAQWRELGVPFSSPLRAKGLEVIDPEALLWCSLEFVASEARLAEGVRAWSAASRTRINRQRLNKFARSATEVTRRQRWQELDVGAPEFAGRTKKSLAVKPIGKRSRTVSTLLLRSRDVLGNDSRSFLIVQLIGSPRGVRLRDVAATTGYTYRSISDAASGWERADVVQIQHGHCVLRNPAPWCELLNCSAAEVISVDWHAAYQASVALLRTLTIARTHRFALDHPLVVSAIRETATALESTVSTADRSKSPAFEVLRTALDGA